LIHLCFFEKSHKKINLKLCGKGIQEIYPMKIKPDERHKKRDEYKKKVHSVKNSFRSGLKSL